MIFKVLTQYNVGHILSYTHVSTTFHSLDFGMKSHASKIQILCKVGPESLPNCHWCLV